MTQHNLTVEKFTRYQTFVLVSLAVLQFMVMLDFMIISPIGHILTRDLAISTNQFGLIVSSYIFSAAASGIVSAGFIDKYDRKKVLCFFFSGFIIGTLFCAFSNSFISLLCARILTGIFGGVIGSVIMTIISDLFAPNQRGRAMSSIQMSFAAAQILGIPLGVFITDRLGWQYTFFLIVLLSVLVLGVLLIKLNPIREHLNQKTDKNPILHLWHTVKNKEHRMGFSAAIILGMSMMLQPFVSIFLVNNIHLSNAQIPIIFMVTGTSAFFIMPLVGRLSDKYDKFRIFLLGSLATIVIVPVYTHLPIVPLWVVLILNVVMFAVIMSRMGPFQALNSMIPQPANRGAYMSMSASLSQMSGGLGIVIAGSIVSQASPESPLENFDVLGYLAVALSAFAIYLVYRISKLIKKQSARA